MKSFRIRPSLLPCSWAIALLLTACGGGGGGGGSADGTSQPSTVSIATSGVAAKGLLSDAKVQVYGISGGKVDESTVLVEGTTDAGGAYKLNIARTGLVMVKLSVVAGKTLMYDEATASSVEPPSTFTLRAVLNLNAGDTPSINLNPFTDAAAAQALASSDGLTAASVAKANADIGTALGFNPLSAAATFDATDRSKPESQLALALAAISEIAKDTDSATLLGCTETATAAQIACVVKSISDKSLANATVVLQLQNKIATVRDVKDVQVNVDVQAVSSTDPAATGTPLDNAKAFFATLRSNAKALNATDMSLQTELKTLADGVSQRSLPLAQKGLEALQIGQKAIEFWRDIKVNNAAFTNNRSFTANGGALGGCSLYQDKNYTVLATDKDNTLYVACGGAETRVRATDSNGYVANCTTEGSNCYTAWSIRVRMQPGADADTFLMNTQTRKAAWVLTGGVPQEATARRINYGADFPGNAATIVSHRDNGIYTAFSLNGELSPSFEITQESTPIYVSGQYQGNTPAVVELLGDKHNVALAASLTDVSAGLHKLSAEGSVEVVKAGVVDSRIELQPGSYVTIGEGAAIVQSEALFMLKASTPDGGVTGSLKVSAFAADADVQDVLPTRIDFSGSVQRAGRDFFSGSFTLRDRNRANFHSLQAPSASNFALYELTATGTLDIPTRPVLTASLSYSEKTAAVKTVAASGQYRQGAIAINGQYSESGIAPGVAVLESTTGIRVVLPNIDGVTTVDVTSNGTKVGVLNLSNSRVTYSDGTFEQY